MEEFRQRILIVRSRRREEEEVMADRSSSFNIDCDAPAYSIVHACQRVGLQSPEDVRWCRVSHFRKSAGHRRDMFDPRNWGSMLGLAEGHEGKCNCGKEMPKLEKYTFTLMSGKELNYYLGQCGGCRTIFWEETTANSPPVLS
jgi:hypothetical protein